jgi:hypothetical protein
MHRIIFLLKVVIPGKIIDTKYFMLILLLDQNVTRTLALGQKAHFLPSWYIMDTKLCFFGYKMGSTSVVQGMAFLIERFLSIASISQPSGFELI